MKNYKTYTEELNEGLDTLASATRQNIHAPKEGFTDKIKRSIKNF